LDPNTVSFIDSKTRDDALRSLVDLLYNQQKVSNKELFYQSIMEREKIVTTGIGMGIAIPHAKLADYDDFFLAIGILKEGVDWGSIDGNPVRLVFMIGGPDDKQTEYLKLLSDVTLELNDEDRRKKLLNLESPEDVMKIFKGF
jgi:PTS system nitrogen regulatory IIA component